MKNFKQLGLSRHLLNLIERENFSEPTEIQVKAIPVVLDKKDVIAGSATGSGKTLVFAAGIIHNCSRGNGIQALVLTPTRELAEQISKVIRKFSKFKELEVLEVYGGVSINPQIMDLRKTDVVVGTPGRILDHIGRKTINLSKAGMLVLDEADRMFDMGFIDDVEKIIRQCPKQRQTLLFSATINDGVVRLSQKHMNNPVKISAETYVDSSKLKQIYYNVADNLKFSLLVHLLKGERKGLVMVFCNSRRTVDFVEKNLRSNNIIAHALHGGFSQAKRSQVMEAFHSNKAHILVCTDVAARGLDIKGVTHIYNYDIPKDAKEYVHRIGRTARAGKEGKAVNLLSTRDYGNYDRVLRDNDVKIEKEEVPKLEKLTITRAENPRDYGGYGRRGGSGGGFGRGGYGNRGRRGGSGGGFGHSGSGNRGRSSSYGRSNDSGEGFGHSDSGNHGRSRGFSRNRSPRGRR